MAELFKGVERNLGMRGFYITSMKKDPQTGHYVGVATWIAGNQAIPGSRVYPKSPIQDGITDGHHQNPKISPDTERHAQIEDSRSEFNQHIEKFKTERRPPRSGFFDPYDSYDM